MRWLPSAVGDGRADWSCSVAMRKRDIERWLKTAKVSWVDHSAPKCDRCNRPTVRLVDGGKAYVPVAVMKPPLWDRDSPFDWICADCHPKAMMALLADFVIVE